MIQSEPENIEQIRERIRKMSDAEPRKYGRAPGIYPIQRRTSVNRIQRSRFG